MRLANSLQSPQDEKPYIYLKEHPISVYCVSQFQKDINVVRMKIGLGE